MPEVDIGHDALEISVAFSTITSLYRFFLSGHDADYYHEMPISDFVSSDGLPRRRRIASPASAVGSGRYDTPP